MKAKKVLSTVLVMAMVAALAGCGGNAASKPAETKPEAATEEKSEAGKEASGDAKTDASGAEYEIIFASHNSTGTVCNDAMDKFAELVVEKSNGRIACTTYPDAVLGTEIDDMQMIKTGEITMTFFGDNFCSQLAPTTDPTIIPYIFSTVEDMKAVYSDPTVGPMIADSVKKACNGYVIGLQDRLPRNLTAKKEITDPSQLKGLKIRVPEIPQWVTVWNAMGAVTTVVDWSECYTALQTGVVDAEENPIDSVYSAKIYEVNPYMMNTEHMKCVWRWVINCDFFDSLPEDLQQIVKECSEEACDYGNKILPESGDKIYKELEDDGKLTRVDVDQAAFKEAAQPGIEAVLKDYEPAVQEYVENYLATH